jgi:type IV pilus assembly protein PilM
MFGILSRNRRGPIGLDVGSEGVKMLQLARSGGNLAVVGAARRSFAQQAAESPDGASRRQLAAEAVRQLLRSGQFRGREVVSCLRADELAIKNIRLPQMPERELASAVLWEARERFEFEVAEDRVHFIRAGEVRQGTETRDEVILIAASAEAVSGHLAMLSDMGLTPAHIDAEPTALFRTYQRYLRRAEDESAAAVLVDVGLVATKVVVARGQTILLIKSIGLAGQQFSESVAKGLGLGYGEALRLRRKRASQDPPGEEDATGDQVGWSVYDAVRSQVESLAREISLCLRYCSVTFRGLRPAQITLTGGEVYDPAVAKLLEQCLGCTCVIGEPLRGVEMSSVDLGADRRSVLTEWSVATGLALRGLRGAGGGRESGRERDRVSA